MGWRPSGLVHLPRPLGVVERYGRICRGDGLDWGDDDDRDWFGRIHEKKELGWARLGEQGGVLEQRSVRDGQPGDGGDVPVGLLLGRPVLKRVIAGVVAGAGGRGG